MSFAILPLIVGLTLAIMSARPAVAQAQGTEHQGAATLCDFAKLSRVHAAAQLSFTLPYTDQPGWASKVSATVPTSWPPAADLLRTPGSPSFQTAYRCLFPGSSVATTSVTLDNDSITILTTSRGQMANWHVSLPLPWTCLYRSNSEEIAFAPLDQFSRFQWTNVAATAHGFTMSSPTPLPVADTNASLKWTGTLSDATAKISFMLTPETLLRAELTAQTTPGYGQYGPYDGEDALFTVVLVALLIRRRPDGRERVDPSDDVRSSTRLLCTVVATFASAEFAYDLVSQLTAPNSRIFVLAYAVQGLIKAAVVSVATIRLFWPVVNKYARLLIIVVVALALMAEENTYFLLQGLLSASDFTFGHFLNPTSYPVSLQIVTTISLSFLCWFIPLSVLLRVVRQRRGEQLDKLAIDRHRWGQTIAIVLATCLATASFVLAVPKAGIANAGYNLSPYGALRLMAGIVIVFGVIRIAAENQRTVPILIDRRNRVLLAVAAGYAMLVALPQLYLGVHLGLVAIITSLMTYAVLAISSDDSLVKLAGGQLRDANPATILCLQGKLADQDRQLGELTKDLKALDSGPTTMELMRQRRRLERESDKLKCWPAAAPAPDALPADALAARIRRLLGLADEPTPRVSLPPSVDPIDMAMAFGPAGGPLENLRMAFKPAFVLVVLPTLYFAWHDATTGSSIKDTLANPSLPLVIALSRELTFWLFPLLILAVVWSSLSGRRGPVRALQVWACISISVGIDAAITEALAQSGVLYAVLRCAILLVCLLILGLWFDLWTLRNSKKAPLFSLLQGYFRLNRLAATLTLILPLATAGLTIWGQVDSGVLVERVPPTQEQLAPNPKVQATAHHRSDVGKVHARRIDDRSSRAVVFQLRLPP